MILARILSALVLAATPLAAAAQDAVPAPAPASIAAIRPDDRVVGSMDAPVTLTAYVSTTCSHCALWHNVYLPAIMTKYVETGRMRIVYRDLPTSPSDIAEAGAVMARCVPAEKFDAALGSLYRTQPHFSPSETDQQRHQKAMPWLAAAGAAGGLTIDQMNACLRDDANWNGIGARASASIADGVTGTPSFFVNGRPTAFGYDDAAALDAMVQPLLTAH